MFNQPGGYTELFTGSVFLLSILSYRLLNKAQAKSPPDALMLKSIKHYGYLNLILAILTASAPLLEKIQIDDSKLSIYEVSALIDNSLQDTGTATVCIESSYANRHLLIKDVATQKVIQVFSRSVTPCVGQASIKLTQQDAQSLGWTDGKTNSKVELVPAAPGQMFVI